VSGNHGRSSAEAPPAGTSPLVPSTTPQQSTSGFVAPASVPVKKTPDITDIIVEVRGERIEVRDEAIRRLEDKEAEGGRQKAESEKVESEKAESEKVESENVESENVEEIIDNSQLTIVNSNVFPEQWRVMFEQVFASVPTIYFSLKETLPEVENNVIKVTVKNEIQKEHFEAKTREVLEFLRTHFDEKIEDVVVVTNEKMETKKIIYDVKDKLQNFKEQNEEFEDFLQILELKIKD